MRVVLYIAMTVNGYIAKADNQTPWSDEEWLSFADFIKQHQNIIIGRKTYEIMQQQNEFDKLDKPLTVVVSNSDVDYNESIIVTQSPQKALQAIKSKGYRTAVVAGGSQLNSSFMQQGLIDEIYVDIEPQIFGEGIRLFAESDFKYQLEIIDVNKISNNAIQLHYKILH